MKLHPDVEVLPYPHRPVGAELATGPERLTLRSCRLIKGWSLQAFKDTTMNSFNNEQVLLTPILFLQLIVNCQTKLKTGKTELKTQKNSLILISPNESHLFHQPIVITASIPVKNNFFLKKVLFLFGD